MRTVPHHPLIATAHTETWSFQHVFTKGNPSITVDLPHDDDGADAGPGRGGEGGKEEQLSFSLLSSFPFPLIQS